MNWIYIIIASIFEVAWTFSLKLLKFNELKTLTFRNILKPAYSLPIYLPLIGYIIFGIGNIYFFSMALKKIPMPIAFATWTALSIIFMKLADIVFNKGKISPQEIFFMLLIISGIIGFKLTSPK